MQSFMIKNWADTPAREINTRFERRGRNQLFNFSVIFQHACRPPPNNTIIDFIISVTVQRRAGHHRGIDCIMGQTQDPRILHSVLLPGNKGLVMTWWSQCRLMNANSVFHKLFFPSQQPLVELCDITWHLPTFKCCCHNGFNVASCMQAHAPAVRTGAIPFQPFCPQLLCPVHSHCLLTCWVARFFHK